MKIAFVLAALPALAVASWPWGEEPSREIQLLERLVELQELQRPAYPIRPGQDGEDIVSLTIWLNQAEVEMESHLSKHDDPNPTNVYGQRMSPLEFDERTRELQLSLQEFRERKLRYERDSARYELDTEMWEVHYEKLFRRYKKSSDLHDEDE